MRSFVYLHHLFDLMVLFRIILLVDTKRIDPEVVTGRKT
jgi:hypothetical protein